MSLLLKSVWRSILRPVVRSPGTTRSLASTSVTTRAQSPDTIMSSLKAAPSTLDVLAAVQLHLPAMTHHHLLHALRCIFHHQKIDNFPQLSDNLIKDPTFSLLCQNFKRHARSLDVNEAIEATKVLTFLGVPVDSHIIQTLLQLLRCQINMLNIRQIMFVDFLLSRFETQNHLVDALKLALPLAFQIHLHLEQDNQDLPLLKDVLSYSCTHDLPDRCINNVVTAILLHDQAIDAQAAKSIIWSLCHVNCTEEIHPTRVQLLHICYDILTQHIEELTYDEVLRTSAKIKGRILEKHPEFYHEQLMDAVGSYAVNKNVDFEKGLLIARVLSRIAHTHLGLAEYLCSQALENPDLLTNARTNILFGFINCLSNNNYTPSNDSWDKLRGYISANKILDGKNAALPWPKFCLELASLGHFVDQLLERVFSKEFLDEYLAKENNDLNYLQLLTLHEAVHTFYSQQYHLPNEVLEKAKEIYPIHAITPHLKQYLIRGLGKPSYVATNVILPNGFISDLVIGLQGGHPIELPKQTDEKVHINDLKLPNSAVAVCVLNFHQGCFSLNSSRLRGTFRMILDILERQGYAAVAVNVTEWLAAPSHERTPYLMREIGYKCGEIGMKLTAT